MASGRKFEGIIISHLGNIDGRQPDNENKLAYVQAALKAGWHVCVDIVFHCGSFLLPWDGGFNPVPPGFLSKQRVWCRAYDPITLDALCNVNAHAFLNSDSGLALTSAQFICTEYPHELVQRSICFLPETAPNDWLDLAEPAGICSNEPARYV